MLVKALGKPLTFPARRRNLPSCRSASSRRATILARRSPARVAPILRASSGGSVDVGDHHIARADVFRNRHGHDADRPGAGDQHIFADQIERQRRMRGVAERIKDRGEIVGDFGGILNALNAGITRYSANAPSRFTPTPTVLRHRCRRPARQLRQKPQVICPSPETRSPIAKPRTSCPSRRFRRHIRGRHASAPESSFAPSRPTSRYGYRCRKSRCA